MILQALYQFAYSKSDEIIADPDYQRKAIPWLLRISKDGHLLPIEDTREQHEIIRKTKNGKESRKTILVARSFAVPCPLFPTARSINDAPYFCCDNITYVLGIDPSGEKDKEKLEKRHRLFLEMLNTCWNDTNDEAIGAAIQALSNIPTEYTVPDDLTPGDWIALVYDDETRLISDRPLVREWWHTQRAQAVANTTAVCLVTGEECVPTHMPPVKKVPGARASGVPIASYNFAAADSYGWDHENNGTISRNAAEATTAALNWLLEYDNGRRINLGKSSAVCFWDSTENDGLGANIAGLLEGNADSVREVYRSVWTGVLTEVEDPSTVYALTISGSQGRVVIRSWIEGTAAEVQNNLAKHFADLSIVRLSANDTEPFGIFRIINALSVDQNQEVPPPLLTAFIRAALIGGPYPLAVLAKAVDRYKHERLTDKYKATTRAALIKAVLNRRQTSKGKEVTEQMNPNETRAPYLLGRLMAVAERMQHVALGNEVNTTIVDRNFGAAMTTPRTVFPRILKVMRYWASKSNVGWLEKEVDSIMGNISDFPAHLNLEQQGLFVLGYHHQRAELWKSRAEREAEATNQNQEVEE